MLKRKISSRLIKDGFSPLPDDYWFKLEKIESEPQLRNEIVYVLRNCLEKGFGMVGGYLWSSAWLYHSDMSEALEGTPARNISKRELSRLLLGDDILPENWLVHPYIGLLPGSFVDVSLVKRLFPEPKDLQTAIVKDYEIFFQIARRLGELQEFNKTEIDSIVVQTLQTQFSGKDLKVLTEAEKGKLAIILNRQFGLDSYQISRSIFVKEKIVRQTLSSKELR